MILVNLAIGLLTMMGCLIVQVGFTFWSVRYAVRHAGEPGSGDRLFAGICTLLMAMVIMMLGNFLQIVLWGTLFLCLGEFSEFYEAVYHSGVNFTSLGYGDVVMSAAVYQGSAALKSSKMALTFGTTTVISSTSTPPPMTIMIRG